MVIDAIFALLFFIGAVTVMAAIWWIFTDEDEL